MKKEHLLVFNLRAFLHKLDVRIHSGKTLHSLIHKCLWWFYRHKAKTVTLAAYWRKGRLWQLFISLSPPVLVKNEKALKTLQSTVHQPRSSPRLASLASNAFILKRNVNKKTLNTLKPCTPSHRLRVPLPRTPTTTQKNRKKKKRLNKEYYKWP